MKYEFRWFVLREHCIRYDGRTSIDPPSEHCVTHDPILQVRSVDGDVVGAWCSVPTEIVDQNEDGTPYKGVK